MRKYLVSTLAMVFISLQLSVYAQQDVKDKVIIESERPSVEITLLDSNLLVVKNAPVGKKIEIYSIVGNKVKEIEIKSSTGEYSLNLPKSIYIIKLGETVRKYVIK